MISSISRYKDARTVVQGGKTVAIQRIFPPLTRDYSVITWKESDRIDRVAQEYCGNPRKWWIIMDLNPQIQDPHDIKPGRQVRVPNNV